jgi:hypothetical protein
MKIPPLLAGVAGEYFVAAELSRRGHIASISLRNTRGIDILATNQEASRSITIQCKTNQLAERKWMLNEKSEEFVSDDHFYVFVALGGVLERASYHIVPSRVVAQQVKESHKRWERTPNREGRAHGHSSIRVFRDPDGEYLERWDLLGL